MEVSGELKLPSCQPVDTFSFLKEEFYCWISEDDCDMSRKKACAVILRENKTDVGICGKLMWLHCKGPAAKTAPSFSFWHPTC